MNFVNWFVTYYVPLLVAPQRVNDNFSNIFAAIVASHNDLKVLSNLIGFDKFLDAIASPSSNPCVSVSQWLIVSDLEIAIASPSFASLFIVKM